MSIQNNINGKAGINVKLKDAFKQDAGRGIIRVDPEITNQQGWKTGDVIEILHTQTSEKTAALLYPGRDEDQNSGIIRINASLRRNLGASLDDIVSIRKIDAALAESIVLVGLNEPVILRNAQQLASKFENRIITKNDIVSFYAYGRRVDLVVLNFLPKVDAVRIHIKAQIIMSEKSYKEIGENKRLKGTLSVKKDPKQDSIEKEFKKQSKKKKIKRKAKIIVKVKDLAKQDTGKGIVKVDPEIINQQGWETEDVLEIWHMHNFKITAALLYPGKVEDKNSGIIRLDASLRKNLDASLDDIVSIRRIDVVQAESVVFAGLEEAVILRNAQQIASKLENRFITKNDIVSFYAYGRKIDIIVLYFVPKVDVVRIHKTTRIIISEKSHKELLDIKKSKKFESKKKKIFPPLSSIGLFIKKEIEKQEKKIIKRKVNIKVKVKGLAKEDIGKGIVKVDPEIINQQGWRIGDVIEIWHMQNFKITAALLSPGSVEDQSSGIIRMDASLRKNLGASLDDIVSIRKIDAALAERVVFAGLEEAVILRNAQQIASKLENRVITKNDIINLYAYGRRVDLIVLRIYPETDAARIHISTEIVLSEKSYKMLKLIADSNEFKPIKKKIQDITEEDFIKQGSINTTVRPLITKEKSNLNFTAGRFEMQKGGEMIFQKEFEEYHIYVLNGVAELIDLNGYRFDLVKDDVIYFHPLKYYKIKNKGQEPFNFICITVFLKRI